MRVALSKLVRSLVTICLFCVLLVQVGCVPEIEDSTSEPAKVTALINGEKFISTEAFFEYTKARVQLNLDQQPDDYRLDIDCQSKVDDIEKEFSLSLFANYNNPFETLEAGDSFTASDHVFNFSANYNLKDDNGTDLQTVSDRLETSICTITKIDRENQLISGTFAFNANNPFDPDDTKVYEIRNGVFTDVKYTIDY